jgi:hypothetical protein
MEERRNPRDTRHTYRAWAALCAIAALLVAAPGASAAGPAINEYSLNFPNSNGKSYPGAETPTARPSELPPIVRQALSDPDRPDGKALATVATAPELGAPDTAFGGTLANPNGEIVSGQTPSALNAISREFDDPAVVLGLLALLGVIGFLAFLARAPRAGTKA